MPAWEAISSSLVPGVALPMATLFVFGAAASIRYVSKAALVVPAALTALVYLLAGIAVTATLAATVTILVITYAIWRYGLLTAMLTTTLFLQLERVIPLLRAGDTHDLLHGIALAALFLGPAALAVVAYRRFTLTPRGSGGHVITGGASGG
jgi:hypothetical protein